MKLVIASPPSQPVLPTSCFPVCEVAAICCFSVFLSSFFFITPPTAQLLVAPVLPAVNGLPTQHVAKMARVMATVIGHLIFLEEGEERGGGGL